MYNDTKIEYITVQATHSAAALWDSKFYFEVALVGFGLWNGVTVGLVNKRAVGNRQIGSTYHTYGVSADGVLHDSTIPMNIPGLTIKAGDTLGCGLDLHSRVIWFTHNGVIVPYRAKNVDNVDLYPAVSLLEPGDAVKFNFTGPFLYSIPSFENTS